MEHKAKLSVALTHIEKKTSYGLNGEGNREREKKMELALILKFEIHSYKFSSFHTVGEK